MLRNPRARIILSLVVLLIVLVAWRWWRGRQIERRRAESVPTTVEVVAARYHIAPRVMIDETMVAIQQIPLTQWQSYDQETQAGIARRVEDVVGRVPSRMIQQGELIHLNDLLLISGLVPKIPPGMRAMVLPVGKAPTHYSTGLMKVGDRVDIVFTFNQQYSRILLENVEVLAIDNLLTSESRLQKAAAEAEEKATTRAAEPGITVAVTPTQATMMALALETAPDLRFLIRPIESPDMLELQIATATSPSEGITMEDIAPLRYRDPEQWRQQQEARRQRALEKPLRRTETAPARSVPPPTFFSQPLWETTTSRLVSDMELPASPSPAPAEAAREAALTETSPPPAVYLIRRNQVERVILGGNKETSKG